MIRLAPASVFHRAPVVACEYFDAKVQRFTRNLSGASAVVTLPQRIDDQFANTVRTGAVTATLVK